MQLHELSQSPAPEASMEPPAPAINLPGPSRPIWQRPAGRLALIAIVVFVMRTFVGEASVVPTGSMEGTILVGDHLFLDKVLYGPEVPLTNWHLPRLKTI